MISSINEQLAPAEYDAKNFLTSGGYKLRLFSANNFLEFFRNIPVVAKMICKEPEILVFVLIQWAVICLAYLAWIQLLKWIPDQLWDAVQQASEENRKGFFALINLVLLGWSFLIVCIASYPISICNAAMVAVHDLRSCRERVTLNKCLTIATKHVGRIWIFTTMDAWITLEAILDRLPKKHGHRTLKDEILYYTWKIATIAVVPSLVNGRQIFQAGRDSISLLTSQPTRTIGLRLGYSAVCWIIGIFSYITSFFIFAKYGKAGHEEHYIYNFYFFMAIPIFVTVGIVSVLIRPFYLLSVAKLYTDLIDVNAEVKKDIVNMPKWESFLFSWKTIIFLMLSSALAFIIFFGNQIGFTEWINLLAHKDLLYYYHQ